MKGSPAVYLGKIVEKDHFRVFVYGPNNEKKLVESWDAFELAMQSGIWFASLEDALASKAIAEEVEENQEALKAKPKSKPRSRSKPKTEAVDESDVSDNVLANDGSVFEVTDES